MQTNKIFLVIVLLYITAFFAHAFILKKTVYGDGIFYYSWIRSVVFDHDINFANEYTYFQVSQPKTTLELSGNKYSIGPALLWFPAFLWTQTPAGGSGYEFPYQLAVGLSSVLYAITGLVLLFILLHKYFSRLVSMSVTLATAGATNLLFYGAIDTVNSHAVSFFGAVLFLTVLFMKKRNWFLIGCTLGLIGLMRSQDLIYGLLVLPFIKPHEIFRFFLGLALFFLPQLTAWQLLYGTFWVSPYISTVEGFTFTQPHILGVLFSLQNGLVLWTPVSVLSFIGFFKKNSSVNLFFMAGIVLVQLYLVSTWSIWWQGASYSGRMFVSVLPILAFGMANLFSIFDNPRFRSTILLYAITIPLSLINALMIVYFLISR